jgi:catechol 2,3-dioxygenase-like lactoylglutathione lyase family enzyme
MPHTLPRILPRALVVVALFLGLATAGFFSIGYAQQATTPAAPRDHAAVSPPDVVVGSGNYSPMVQDLDKAIEFYSLLGLTVPPAQAPGPRPVNTDPALLDMFGIPGAQLRFLTARIPGAPFGVEMVEVRGRDKKAVRPRIQDAGNATLILMVRDMAAALAPLKKAGVPIVTPGGEPMAIGNSPSIIVSDPDGHYVELRQPVPLPPTTAPANSNVIGARVRFTVANTERTLRFYRDLLHMQPQVGEFIAAPLLGLMGLKGAQAKVTTIAFPVSELLMGFVELKGVTRTPVRPALPDPGATRFQVRVKDLDATIATLKTAGSHVVSAGGVPAALNASTRAAIMPDPDGIYLVLIQAQPQPPRPAAQ